MWTRDLRLALRGLRRGALPAAGAAAMLSAGLTAVLLTSALGATLLRRQVSATHGDALRRVTVVDRRGQASMRLSFVEIDAIRRHLADAADVTAVNMQPVIVRAAGTEMHTMAEVVDGLYFSLIGEPPLIGRPLLPSDDAAGAPPAAVIAEPLWRDRFNASPSVLGQTIAINGQPFSIVGVARASGSSTVFGASVDVWAPLTHADTVLNRGWRTNVGDRWFTAFALPRASVGEIDGRFAATVGELAVSHPDPWRDRQLRTAPALVLAGGQRTGATTTVAVLVGLSLLILAAAASNVGGVLLARAAAARRQIAIHLSLGSGRAAIVRRQVLEGALIGLAAAAIALGLYAWARTFFMQIALLPTLALRLDLPFTTTLALIGAALGVAFGAGLALGPALWSTRVDLTAEMRDADSRASSGLGVTRMRKALISVQICLSLTLTVGSALFIRSLTALTQADLGFSRQQLVAMDFDLEPAAAPMSDLPRLAREALARAETTPGVVAAAMSSRAPIDQSTPSLDVRASSQDAAITDVTYYTVTSRYFETIGLPIVAGRAFSQAEIDAASDVVIVNERLARRLWPDGDVVDRRLYVGVDGTPVRVVGVARDSKYRSISEPPRPHLYRPTRPSLGLSLLARTSDEPHAMLRALQRTLDGVGPGLVGFFPRTFDDHLAIDLLPTRAAAAGATVLGVIALLFSAVGLYGLAAWFVELRRREIGVRMALGATPGAVRALVLRQALAAALPGIIGGVALAATLGVVVRFALFGISPLDPAAFATGVGCVLAIVLAAAYIPSRRATRLDPVRTLRDG